VDTPISVPTQSERELLFDWLERAARRMWARQAWQEAGWLICSLLAAVALYLLLAVLQVPGPALTALAALLSLAAVAVTARFAWRCMRRVTLSRAAHAADTVLDLKDELKSALWFAQQDHASAAELLMLSRTAQTVHRFDPRKALPLRVPRSFLTAATLGAVALALSLAEHGNLQTNGAGVALAGDLRTDPRARSEAGAAEQDADFRFDANASSPLARKTQAENELWAKAETVARSLNAEEGAELQRAIQARDLKRVRELLEPAEQAGRASLVDPGSRAQAGQVSAEVAQGILERLQSLLGEGAEPKPENPAMAAADHEAGVAGWRDNSEPNSERRDTEQHTTLDALNDALRALSQAATGDRPMANSPPSQASQNNGKTNINGGAMGMRVNTSQAGEGGEDTPPDTPSEGIGEPVLGKPTLRLAAQLQRLNTGAGQSDAGGSAAEGFYAATQAQAARFDFQTAEAPVRGADEAALTREQVPIAYRSSVKRYFLTEHGKER